MVAGEVVRLEEQEDPAAGLVADAGRLLRRRRLREEQPRPSPGGATTTQRLPSGSGVSATSAKPRASVNQAIASS